MVIIKSELKDFYNAPEEKRTLPEMIAHIAAAASLLNEPIKSDLLCHPKGYEISKPGPLIYGLNSGKWQLDNMGVAIARVDIVIAGLADSLGEREKTCHKSRLEAAIYLLDIAATRRDDEAIIALVDDFIDALTYWLQLVMYQNENAARPEMILHAAE